MNRILLTALLGGLVLAGLGCASQAFPNSTGSVAEPAAPPMAQPMPAMEDSAANQGKSDAYGGEFDDGVAAQPTAQAQAQGQERMIVYTGLISLQVNDTAEAINQINTILDSVNGYIASRSVVEYGENKLRGTISIRVPAAALENTLSQIRALGVKVLRETQDSNDVTAEYTDLDARRKNMEAYEVELQALLETVRERTGKADEILAVYNQLTQVRGEIEQIKGRQNYLQNTSALATYTVEFVPVEEVVVQGDPGWNPGQTAAAALDRLVTTLQSLGDVAINLALFVIPVLLIMVLPLVLFVLVLRAILKRRSNKKPVTA
jgi:hypothetical protein